MPSALVELSINSGRPTAPFPASTFDRCVFLRRLIIDGNFDYPLPPGCLPASLRRLRVFSDKFTSPLLLNMLPAERLQLELGGGFDQPIADRGVLPASLHTLSLDGRFNQPIAPGVLPAALRHLSLGEQWSGTLTPSVLPPSLATLHLDDRFVRPAITPGSLPDTLYTLIFSRPDTHTLPQPLPACLVSLDDGRTQSTDRSMLDDDGTIHTKHRHTAHWWLPTHTETAVGVPAGGQPASVPLRVAAL